MAFLFNIKIVLDPDNEIKEFKCVWLDYPSVITFQANSKDSLNLNQK